MSAKRSGVLAYVWVAFPLLDGLVGAGQELVATAARSEEGIYRFLVYIIRECFHAICIIPGIFVSELYRDLYHTNVCPI